MEERKGLIQWIKEHKKELTIAGISVGALILIVLGIKNHKAIIALWDSLKKVPEQPVKKASQLATKVAEEIPAEAIQISATAIPSNANSLPYEVSRHIRNLHDGWHASPEKVAEALKNNIILMDGQTWVDSYMKGVVAA